MIFIIIFDMVGAFWTKNLLLTNSVTRYLIILMCFDIFYIIGIVLWNINLKVIFLY